MLRLPQSSTAKLLSGVFAVAGGVLWWIEGRTWVAPAAGGGTRGKRALAIIVCVGGASLLGYLLGLWIDRRRDR